MASRHRHVELAQNFLALVFVDLHRGLLLGMAESFRGWKRVKLGGWGRAVWRAGGLCDFKLTST
jgi:hypothetical protein